MAYPSSNNPPPTGQKLSTPAADAAHETSDSRYLARLTFNPELRKSWLNFFVSNARVVVLLILLLTAWGIFAFTKLPRESNPEVKIPIAVVTVAYPGASPADVEELVTKKVETSVAGLKGVKQITSNSANSISVVTVEFEASEDLEDAIRRLRDNVATLKPKLPDNANDPAVMEISLDNTPIWSISLTGPYDGLQLRSFAHTVQDELEKIPGVREVNVSGGDEVEFSVAYDPGRLNFYGISADRANSAIRAANVAIPAGNMDGSVFSYPLRTDGRFHTVEALAALPVGHAPDGTVVRLSDIAEVREQARKRTELSRLSIKGAPAQPAVNISVIKKTGGNVIATVDEARATVDRLLPTFGAGVTYDTTLDFAKYIREDFDRLTHDFTLTLLLVAAILTLIVGVKEALVAGLAIPLVFFATFGVMLATGITLNFLSIFSLILSLGLLVDDAIVVVSATKQYLKTGKYTPEEAVLLVLNDFKVVLTTTTLTTVWAFLPLLMSTGIMGEFIKSIPITVSVTLLTSLLIALMVNHPLAAVLERIRLSRRSVWFACAAFAAVAGWGVFMQSAMGAAIALLAAAALWRLVRWYRHGGREQLRANEELVRREWNDDELIKQKLRTQAHHVDASLADRLLHGIVHFDRVLPLYERTLRAVIGTKKARAKLLGGVAAAFIAALALVATGVVPTEFFPASDENTLYVNLRAPIGTKLERTNLLMAQVEAIILKYPEVANFSTVVGREGISPNRGSGSMLLGASDRASMTISLVDDKERTRTSYELASRMQEEVSQLAAEVFVESPRGGPPSGAAFEARISGDDLQELDRIARRLKELLGSISGVANPAISLKDAPADYTFALDPTALEQHDLNAAVVGATLRMAVSGAEITTVIRGNDDVEVMARFAPDTIPTLEAVQNLQILNLRGEPVYLKDVARVTLQPSLESITRIDQRRTVVLSAGVTGIARPNEVLKTFQERLASEVALPDGYAIVYGGENEQNTESVTSILQAMIVAALLIVSTLIVQFNSFRKAIIVLVTFPLALIGVFWGMAAFQVTLSFPGLIGILALFGIVVKNAIILIDKMNLNLKAGIPFEDAVVDAGKSRLEAIFITSICTIFGIIPITLSNALWMALGSAVIFGLALSSFLTLFVVPALFITFMKPTDRV